LRIFVFVVLVVVVEIVVHKVVEQSALIALGFRNIPQFPRYPFTGRG
jgi:hypothetical protein